jgi:uncharacterized protein (TIGR02246 family)
MRNDEQEIRELVDKWMSASANGDTDTVLGLMSDDVIFMVPGKEPFGKDAFAASSNAMKDVHIEGKSDIQEMKVLGDWAWLRNHLKVTITPPNGTPATRSGYTLTILRRNNKGQWVIARDANLLTPESD